MNKPLRRVAVFCGLLVLALLIRVNYVQFVTGDELANDKHNRRVSINQFAQPRGDIIVDGKSLTGSVETPGSDFKYKATFKDGPMWAPVTGYASQAYQTTFLEGVYDKFLTGNDDRLFFNRTIDMLTGKEKQGGKVITTLNAKAQLAAFTGLGNKKGAVAALDPRTGAILALASTPSYDPSTFAGSSTKTDQKNWLALQKANNPDDPMLNRALRQVYPPGSTFKVVTAAAALENGDISKITDIDAPTDSPLPYKLPQSSRNLENEGDLPCKNASLRVALKVSCNTVFGHIGDVLKKDKMREQAEKFGFNQEIMTPVRADASVYSKEMDAPSNVLSAIGQYNTAATPLQMAMVAAAIANDGKLMQPYMVDKLQAPNLNVIEQTKPHEFSQPVSAANAQKLQQMMETVVKEGTGTNAQIDGVTVGGKTGTAQNGVGNSKNPYAWFISYAKTADGSPVAVAVVVEDSDASRGDISGGGLAAPIAKKVMEAVLNK
ncbi:MULTISPECIES: peptidoglycan D,D-transpeptidase FtsI family protein [unclassified Streptomyces]|uniref:peptidoglycan D,D-transpeptidase FtsI family protein n=1 Tax=unclassified Streptomyces TaxID=2593676 RepID=UPI002033BEFA|nr:MULTISPECIES: penicillin-binding protein 2 [unclassified Streptomyces]MCM2420451.1 penicillin-binding protein 2 [Streptomyces sp. RKAG293]MCM2427330.1 penicillin-binding protein 2 [Streptomyces sp. RKAG337]